MEQDRMNGKFCVIIPAFKEARRIGEVVSEVLKHIGTVIVVDDGSPDSTSDAARQAGATVLRHDTNKGKAEALNTGFKYACSNGFEAVITMDGDGQHDPEDLDGFLKAYEKDGCPVLIGNRMTDPEGMPLIRRWTNQFTSWLLSREMKQHVPDTQSGYRLYKCEIIPKVWTESGRFAAESEILLRISELGLKIGAVPIQVIYRDEKSKINPITDAFRFFKVIADHRRAKRKSG
ncbi:MAG: glycosyltransferase family 2 protein [bacterium]